MTNNKTTLINTPDLTTKFNFKAIIFDMDGLLVDSEVIWQAAETELFTSRGHVYTEEVRAPIVGMRVDAFMDYLRNYYRLPESVEMLVDELNQRMIKLIPHQVPANPGAQELLNWIVQNNIPRAIASNSSREIIDVTVETQGWGEIFQVRCTGDDEQAGKPAPDVYLTAARRLGVDPRDCVALEDSLNGSRAVVAAGMTCFAVPDRSHSKPEDFREITPYVFNDLHEVLAVLTDSPDGRSSDLV